VDVASRRIDSMQVAYPRTSDPGVRAGLADGAGSWDTHRCVRATGQYLTAPQILFDVFGPRVVCMPSHLCILSLTAQGDSLTCGEH